MADAIQVWKKKLLSPQALRRIEQCSILPHKPTVIANMALTQIVADPKLARCTPESVFHAVYECCHLGLMPLRSAGQAYFVPYTLKGGQTVCQLIPGYRGYIQLILDAGVAQAVQAVNVYEGDEYRWVPSAPPLERIHHVPAPPVVGADGRDERRHVASYAIIDLAGGGRHSEWMWAHEIEAIRKRSRARNDGPWVTGTDMMRRKTVVRRAVKFLKITPQMARLTELDDLADTGRPQFVDVEEVGHAADRAGGSGDDRPDGDRRDVHEARRVAGGTDEPAPEAETAADDQGEFVF